MNDFFLFFLLASSASIGIVTTVAMIMVYLRQRRSFTELETEYDKLWERVLLHSEAMIKKAHRHALKIIEDSEFISSDMKQHVREALVEAEQKEAEEYQKTMDQIQKKITSESVKQLHSFSTKLLEETKKNEQVLEKKTESVQAELEKYIQERKTELNSKLEEHIFKIVQSVLEDVSGKLLSQEQHEQLILEALQKAKQDHVL